MSKTLVIDDEVSEKHPLGKRIKKLLEPEGFEILFSNSGREGIEVLKNDNNRSIKLVFLDILFDTGIGGKAIYEEIRKFNTKIPIVILTKVDSYLEIDYFLDRGAALFIVKKHFERKTPKLLNYIKSISEDPLNSEYSLILTLFSDKLSFMDITDKSDTSILKRKRKLTVPISKIVKECAVSEDKSVIFPEESAGQPIKELDGYRRSEIHKEIWKFNNGIKNSSLGKIHSLLRGLGIHGATGFELVIGDIKIIEKKHNSSK